MVEEMTLIDSFVVISIYTGKVTRNITDDFYNKHDYWIEYNPKYKSIVRMCFYKAIESQKAARIIERLFHLYKLKDAIEK